MLIVRGLSYSWTQSSLCFNVVKNVHILCTNRFSIEWGYKSWNFGLQNDVFVNSMDGGMKLVHTRDLLVFQQSWGLNSNYHCNGIVNYERHISFPKDKSLVDEKKGSIHLLFPPFQNELPKGTNFLSQNDLEVIWRKRSMESNCMCTMAIPN